MKRNVAKLKSEPVVFNDEQRQCVHAAIKECCKVREWGLYALNVRTNHGHLVVANNFNSSGQALGAIKANATRELRERGLWTYQHSPWADKRSRRRLWNAAQIDAAVDYVLYGQGDDIPAFLAALD